MGNAAAAPEPKPIPTALHAIWAAAGNAVPAVWVDPGQTFELADIKGPGAIQSIWITGSISRNFILRMYWDDQEQPAVEAPLPDFFAVPWATKEGDAPGPFRPGQRPTYRRQSRTTA